MADDCINNLVLWGSFEALDSFYKGLEKEFKLQKYVPVFPDEYEDRSFCQRKEWGIEYDVRSEDWKILQHTPTQCEIVFKTYKDRPRLWLRKYIDECRKIGLNINGKLTFVSEIMNIYGIDLIEANHGMSEVWNITPETKDSGNLTTFIKYNNLEF